MSEPKARAKSVKSVVPGVYTWSIKDERIGGNESDAHAVVEGGSVVLIDPLPLSAAAEASLRRRGRIEAVVLTSAWHQRSAWTLRKKFGAKVWAPKGAKGFDEKPDRRFAKGHELPGGLLAVHTPGPAEATYGFLKSGGGGVFFCPDLLIHMGGGKLGFLPDEYMESPRRTRASAKKLLDLRFRTICFGHGRPLTSGVRQSIAKALKPAPKK